ncbi:Uu.00g028460.m01.CDS01 [Anthostomella pinea]|uniref:Multiple RNA-binding domain-containing protein 1 n=1 Tax=Anthostomella pinea TaxID=933095 RepID=A0AAI8V7Z2_9PEZI|nr:Uu.00g028460.m01.CDS01 [Anthostomella pinea]
METSRIFIKGLPPTITNDELQKHFSQKAPVTDVKCIPQRRIGYVGYKSAEEAARAVKYFNRTFIRMSRISVEPAKPVADPSLSRGRDEEVTTTPRASTNAPPTSEANPETAKKRKRDDIDESDPKLQEFLDVMNPSKGATNKIHEFQGEDVTEPPTKYAAVAADDGESDDDYQPLPKKVPQRETRHPASPPPPVAARHLSPTSMDVGQDGTERQIPQAADGIAEPAKTDDDWLRQRTNRLLDLVDDDDVPNVTPTRQSPAKSPAPAEMQLDAPQTKPDEVCQTSPPNDNKPATKDDVLDTIRKSSRLFVRNLPYSATEDDLRKVFREYGSLEEVHIPSAATKPNRGMGFVLFTDPEDAVKAYQSDRTTFQGRILHVLPGTAKRELDEFALSRLPLKKQQLIKKKNKAAVDRFNWNSLYMSADAVNSSVASKLGISKSELLDPTSADAAVKQAIAETSTIQDSKSYFAANGVNLDAFASKSAQRRDDVILVKNFSYGTTTQEIRSLFEEHGQVLRVLMPPAGTIAIVQFAETSAAKAAFMKLAYRRLKDSIIFLEKAPRDLFSIQEQVQLSRSEESAGLQKPSVAEMLARDDGNMIETSSLFVKNLAWETNTKELAATFEHLEGFRSAIVKTKKDAQKGLLSMGFGFVEFRDKGSAEAAAKVMDGHVLRAHKLQVRAAHRGQEAAEERKKEDRANKAAGTRLLIKNVPFQVTSKKDIRTLLGTYGTLKAVRLPKNYAGKSKGYCFADFVSPKDAQSALDALKDTHLLGRRLVIEYADTDAVDAEEEIAKMQKKVGGQANKVALQKLLGQGSRKKVTLGAEDEEGDQ